MIHLILGGARSGKSRLALALAENETRHCHFVATAEVVDDEFSERIQKHRQERDSRWQTIETPLELVETLQQLDQPNIIIVVDCLSVWLGNLMHHQKPHDRYLQDLLSFLPTAKAEIRFVSNEVGLGLVPETPMGRVFRDLQGRINQDIASLADQVQLVVAGIPVQVKP